MSISIVNINKIERVVIQWPADDQSGFKKAKTELKSIYGNSMEYITFLFGLKKENGKFIHEWTVDIVTKMYCRNNK